MFHYWVICFSSFIHISLQYNDNDILLSLNNQIKLIYLTYLTFCKSMLWWLISTYHKFFAYFNSFWLSYILITNCAIPSPKYRLPFRNITMVDSLLRHSDIPLDAVCNRKWQATDCYDNVDEILREQEKLFACLCKMHNHKHL